MHDDLLNELRLSMIYYFLDIDNNFTKEKSYILSFISKLPPLFSVDELTALQIIPDPPVVNANKNLGDIIANAKSEITTCILKEHQRKGSYEKISRVNIIVNMIHSNVKTLEESHVNVIGSGLSITDFHKRVIFYFFYISIIGISYTESEKKAIWDLSNRWNIDTSAISDMDEPAEQMLKILAQKKSVITDKKTPYKEAKPLVEALDAKWSAELGKACTMLFGEESKAWKKASPV